MSESDPMQRNAYDNWGSLEKNANCYNVSKSNELTIEAWTMKFVYDRLLIHHSSVPIGVM